MAAVMHRRRFATVRVAVPVGRHTIGGRAARPFAAAGVRGKVRHRPGGRGSVRAAVPVGRHTIGGWAMSPSPPLVSARRLATVREGSETIRRRWCP